MVATKSSGVPANLTMAMRYGPQTQSAVRRSQYLADALKQMQQDGPKITGGVGELAAKLGATFLLKRGADKADKAALAALKADQEARTTRMLAGLPGGLDQAPEPPAPTAPSPSPQLPLPPPPVPVQQAPLPPAQPQPMAGLGASPGSGQPRGLRNNNPLNLEATIPWKGMTGTDGRYAQFGTLDDGLRAADRNLQTYGEKHGLNTVGGVIARWAPAAENGASTSNYARFVAQKLGVEPNQPLNMADPQVRQSMALAMAEFENGRPIPNGSRPPPPTQPAQSLDQPGPIQDQPFQLAANGPMQPGMVPQGSAPPSLPGGGMPPGPSSLPQGGPGGASPGNWRPTPQQVELVKRYLTSPDPEERAMGEAMYYQFQAKMAEPVEYVVQMQNGVPVYVPKTPGQGQVQTAGGVPAEAQTQRFSADQIGQMFGIQVPPGTVGFRDPTGNWKFERPQQGQQVASRPGEAYREAPIAGGSNDPAAGSHLIANEGKLRDDYTNLMKPYAVAREGYQKVVEAARTATPAGDIAMIFGYMKTLDPSSTVREGEYATVQNSGTVDQTVANLYNRMLTGKGSLSPEQRAEFADSARRQFDVYQRTADQLTARYGELATSYGFDPTRIVQKYPAIEPFAATPPTPGGALAAPPQALRDAMTPAQLKAVQPYRGKVDARGQRFPVGSKENPQVPVTPRQYEALPAGAWFIDDDGSLVQKGRR